MMQWLLIGLPGVYSAWITAVQAQTVKFVFPPEATVRLCLVPDGATFAYHHER